MGAAPIPVPGPVPIGSPFPGGANPPGNVVPLPGSGPIGLPANPGNVTPLPTRPMPVSPPTSSLPPAGEIPTNSYPPSAPAPAPSGGGLSLPAGALPAAALGGGLAAAGDLAAGKNPASAALGGLGQAAGQLGGLALGLPGGPEFAIPLGLAGGMLGHALGNAIGDGLWDLFFPPHAGGVNQPVSMNPWKNFKPFNFGQAGKYYDLHNFATQEDVYKPNDGSPGFDITRSTETRLNPALAPFNVFAINNGNSTTIYLFDATNKSIELGGYWDGNDPKATSYLKTTPGLQATLLEPISPPENIPVKPTPIRPPNPFVIPLKPDNQPQPFKPHPPQRVTPPPPNYPPPYPPRKPTPIQPIDPPKTPEHLPPGTHPALPPGTKPGTDPGTHPGSNPGTSPSVQPGVTPGTLPGANPGGNPGSKPKKTVDPIGNDGKLPEVKPNAEPVKQEPPGNNDCCNPCPDPCPEIPKPEFETVTVKVFDSCQTQSDGTIKPTFTDKSLSVPKGTANEVKTLFERIANLEALQCVTKDDCCVTIPDWWSARVGADRPQLSIQYYNVADSKKIPNFCVNLPHPDPNLDISKIRISDYQKGNYIGVLTLSDNSKLIINAVSMDEAERVINELSSLIDASYLTGEGPKLGKRGGPILKQFTARAKIVKLFRSGQKNLTPDQVAYIDESS